MNPIRLIKLEILKYKDNSLVQMLLLFYTILMPTVIFVMKNFESISILPGKSSVFTFPLIWEYQSYIGSWLALFFLGFLGVYLITSEIQFKTMRQNIITGLTRYDFFLGKVYIMLVIAIYATIVFYLSSIIIGVIHEGKIDFTSIMKHQDYVFLRFFLLSFAYMIFGMFVALFIRKPALSIFFYFTYILAIEPLFRWWIHLKYFTKILPNERIMLFYPLNGIEDLAPSPAFKYVESFIKMKDFPILLSYTEAGIVSIISVLIFIICSYYLIVKKDI